MRTSLIEDAWDSVKFALTLGEIIKPFVPLFAEVSTITKEIIKAYDDAQYNKKSCSTLIDRVQAADIAVQALNRRKDENEEKFKNERFYISFERFVAILKQVRTFVQDVTRLSGYQKFISSASIKERFAQITGEFDSCVSDLKLAMIISNEEQRQRDFQILEEDLAEMAKFIESIDGGVTTMMNVGHESFKGISTILKEVRIMNEKVELLIPSSGRLTSRTQSAVNINEDFQPTNIDPNDLEDVPEPENKRGKVIKKHLKKQLSDVCCKPINLDVEKSEKQRIQAQLAILGKLQQSPQVIKFWGLSNVNNDTVLVYEWAQYGTLKEVYEKFELDWHRKLKIAIDICRGIAFLHGCEIFHHDIRCANILLTEKMEPKITNFEFARVHQEKSIKIKNIINVLYWMAPEKMKYHKAVSEKKSSAHVPYTVQCEIFSFGMLLWELAFQRIPYANMEMTKILEHVVNGKRERFDFGLSPTSLQYNFQTIIQAAWQHDPSLRPDVKYLFNKLDSLFKENFAMVNSPLLRPRKPKDVDSITDFVIKEEFYIKDDIPFEPLLPLEQGIKAHRKGEHEKAWKCFEGHADIDNPIAKYYKAYYLWDGIHVTENKDIALKLFKETADRGVTEAQLRYAFALAERVKPLDSAAFVKYLTLAANGGNVVAQYNLGDLYINGKLGFNKDETKGIEYLRLAAFGEHEKAIKLLQHLNIDIYKS
ncbi:815_t:CDS:2 [Acaulospora morrowiae]|uniref:815_t:CDS:1 n=1 Tax=Acaulospora morrowiae TaxID=94023 RepID=A0A9N9AZ73_9GLOM|nr:815_t:CDS:2 [Acaulospora morrowiae]